MPDDFQQIKGFLGQQVAKFHLEKIRGYKIVDEEVKVEGVNGRARIDIVVQRDNGVFSPVEVKCQQYRIDQYGQAFEYVLNELREGRKVYGIDRKEHQMRLAQPILYLWLPPSTKVTELPFYSAPEVVMFEDAVQEIRREYGNSFIGEIVRQTEHLINAFFIENHNCILTERYRHILETLFSNGQH